ncbi:MAG: hypothetical protein P8010_02270 [Desulfosarcinaceae bacterium]
MGNLARLQRFFACFEITKTRHLPRPTGKTLLRSRFCDAMDDDFNFPRALALIFAEIRSINRSIATGTSSSGEDRAVRRRVIDLKGLCQNVLGLRLNRSMSTPFAGWALP